MRVIVLRGVRYVEVDEDGTGKAEKDWVMLDRLLENAIGQPVPNICNDLPEVDSSIQPGDFPLHER